MFKGSEDVGHATYIVGFVATISSAAAETTGKPRWLFDQRRVPTSKASFTTIGASRNGELTVTPVGADADSGVLNSNAAELVVDTDRNLLFGVLALQADLLDADRFIKACTLWTARKETSLPGLLIELGWITPSDKADVERLLERKLKKHGGEPKAGLGDVADHIKRSLAVLQDKDIQRSVAGLPEPGTLTMIETVDSVPRAQGQYCPYQKLRWCL